MSAGVHVCRERVWRIELVLFGLSEPGAAGKHDQWALWMADCAACWFWQHQVQS